MKGRVHFDMLALLEQSKRWLKGYGRFHFCPWCLPNAPGLFLVPSYTGFNRCLIRLRVVSLERTFFNAPFYPIICEKSFCGNFILAVIGRRGKSLSYLGTYTLFWEFSKKSVCGFINSRTISYALSVGLPYHVGYLSLPHLVITGFTV